MFKNLNGDETMEQEIIANMTVADVARFAGCHDHTVRSYERKGHIKAYRDFNNFRRFTLEEAIKLKEILSCRKRTE
jgi:DNA-binding transcriptional MerR regulator